LNWRSLPRRLPLAAALVAIKALVVVAWAPWDLTDTRVRIPLGLDAYMPIPEDNPLSPQRADLGRRLFFDPILSRNRQAACATCHDPNRAFTDGRRVAVGVFGRQGDRNAPTLVNRGYGQAFFWDGRARSLEEQVLQPIQNPAELDLDLAEAVARLTQDRGYRRRFDETFGRNPNARDLARALAGYVRTILSGDSPVDRALNGARDALSSDARLGLQIFRGKGNCSVCHSAPAFTDDKFHNTGVAWRDGLLLDQGRFAVTAVDADRGAFKTPTLREIARTAPYMHDGSLSTLDEVIDYYDRGGNPNPHLDPELRPLHLAPQEKSALRAFLKALSGKVRVADIT